MWLKTYGPTQAIDGRVNSDHIARIEPAQTTGGYVVHAVMADGITRTLSPQTYETHADADAEVDKILHAM